jgi:uncharacterized protein YegL
MSEQILFGTNDFTINPEPRVPCVLLLDTSGSMNGSPITTVNAALPSYRDALAADALAARRVETALVTFGGQVQTVCDFTTVEGFHPPTLVAGGDTPMGAAITTGLEMVRKRKDVYKQNGVGYYRPWVILITDGGPTDKGLFPLDTLREQIRLEEARKGVSFYAVGVEGANFDVLTQLSVTPPLKLIGLRFQEFFLWLSASQSARSRSTPGADTPLPSVAAWGTAPG